MFPPDYLRRKSVPAMTSNARRTENTGLMWKKAAPGTRKRLVRPKQWKNME